MNTSPETLDALEAEILKLPVEDRALLLDQVAVSLAADSEVEGAWEEEIERRDAQLQAGTADTVSLADVVARLRARHFP